MSARPRAGAATAPSNVETDSAHEALDPDEYNEFVSSLTLASIELAKISGERRATGDAPLTKFEFQVAYQVHDLFVNYRFDVQGHLTDEAEFDYGEVGASVIVAFEVKSPPSELCIERFGSTSVAMMAHPYLREVLASTALRLGFQGVTLPMVVKQPSRD